MTPALLLLALALPPPPPSLDVVFVPDAPTAPLVFIAVEDTGVHRALVWALAAPVAGGSARGAGALADDQQGRGFSTLPAAPRGATVLDRGGAVSITIDDAGDWAEPLQALPHGGEGLPLPGPRALRLVVDPAAGSPAPAVLYGAGVRLPGRAVVRRDAPAVWAVVLAGKDVVDAAGSAVDLVAGCGRTVPSAVSAVAPAPLKLLASGPAVCAGDRALVPVAGSRLDTRKDVPARGVVVSR